MSQKITKIDELLRMAQERNASDLHLRAMLPPFFRLHGTLVRLSDQPVLAPKELSEILSAIASEEQMKQFMELGELDFAYSLLGTSRIRVNASTQKGEVALTFRLLPAKIPALEKLELPSVCKSLAMKHRGLVIVAGPTGSGKSTTLAAMIAYLNETVPRHIVTIEDPIEFLHESNRCLISQRELGTDTRSFATALKYALRQDPNVILVGEMREPETAAAALTAAETGHLVMTTGHASSAPETIDRVLSLFPPHEEAQERARLASILEGVLCQTLIPRQDGSGRVVAVEVMLATNAVRNLIREGKTYQLANVIRTSIEHDMQTMDQALLGLHHRGVISREEALSRCSNREEMAKLTGAVNGYPNSASITHQRLK